MNCRETSLLTKLRIRDEKNTVIATIYISYSLFGQLHVHVCNSVIKMAQTVAQTSYQQPTESKSIHARSQEIKFRDSDFDYCIILCCGLRQNYINQSIVFSEFSKIECHGTKQLPVSNIIHRSLKFAYNITSDG